MKVFDFALKLEEDGKKFYEKLAAETNVPELHSIYSLLAAAEEEHRNTLAAMREKIAPDNADSEVIEKAKNIFQTLLERKHLPETLKRDHDGCRHALGMAMAGIRLYERMAEREPNPAVANIFRMLAEEEKNHLQIMENIYDFIAAPKTFLVWGEFSNLREL